MFAACATQTFIQHTRVLSSRRMSNTEGTVQLSKSWKVVRQHRGFYTGGKVVLSSSNRFLVCLHGEDLCLLELSTGTVAHTVEAESDAILAFALHKNEQDLVIACQSGLIKHIKLDLENKKHTVARSFKGTTFSHSIDFSKITFSDFLGIHCRTRV
jgi:tricorn protease-like protein